MLKQMFTKQQAIQSYVTIQVSTDDNTQGAITTGKLGMFQQGQRRSACSTGYQERTGSGWTKPVSNHVTDQLTRIAIVVLVESRLSQTPSSVSDVSVEKVQSSVCAQCAAQIEYLTQTVIMESSTRMMFAFILLAAFITHCYAKSKLFEFSFTSVLNCLTYNQSLMCVVSY